MIDLPPPVNYNNILLDTPNNYQHIVMTDGYYYRSGYWIDAPSGGFFYPDPNEPFVYLFWAPTKEEIFIEP